MLKTNLPVLILNDVVLFPSCEIKLEIEDSVTKKILALAESYFNGHLLVVYSEKTNPAIDELPKIFKLSDFLFKACSNLAFIISGVSSVFFASFSGSLRTFSPSGL